MILKFGEENDFKVHAANVIGVPKYWISDVEHLSKQSLTFLFRSSSSSLCAMIPASLRRTSWWVTNITSDITVLFLHNAHKSLASGMLFAVWQFSFLRRKWRCPARTTGTVTRLKPCWISRKELNATKRATSLWTQINTTGKKKKKIKI